MEDLPKHVYVSNAQKALDALKSDSGLSTQQVILMARLAGKNRLPKVCTLMTTRYRNGFRLSLANQVRKVLSGELQWANVLSARQYETLRPCEKDAKWASIWQACIYVEEGLVH